MLVQTEAQIYLANQRGVTHHEGFRSFHTLNFGAYLAEGREPVGRLIAFNDETLMPQRAIEIKVDNPTEIILLPTVGGLELIDHSQESIFVSAGESFRFIAFPESTFKIVNPYPTETIGYLQIHLKPDLSCEVLNNLMDETPLNSFSLEENNRLVQAFTSTGKSVSARIGQYDGREEDTYTISKPENAIFTYVINGAFEVQNRLLETGDALAFWNAEDAEFEALSNGAVILVAEVGMF
jgi:hypothetical protein